MKDKYLSHVLILYLFYLFILVFISLFFSHVYSDDIEQIVNTSCILYKM